MTPEEARTHCLSQPHAWSDFPFGPEAEVFKVGQKMFALLPIDAERPYLSLKGDPDWNEVLRQNYQSVQPAYHMNKRHWNMVYLDGEVPDDEICEMIETSYRLVARSLPKAK